MGEGEKPEEEVEWGEEEGEEGPFSRGRSVPVRESAAISIKTAPAAPVNFKAVFFKRDAPFIHRNPIDLQKYSMKSLGGLQASRYGSAGRRR